MIPRSSKTLKTSVGPRQERRRLTAFNSTLESDNFFSNDYVSDQLSSRSEEDDTGDNDTEISIMGWDIRQMIMCLHARNLKHPYDTVKLHEQKKITQKMKKIVSKNK